MLPQAFSSFDSVCSEKKILEAPISVGSKSGAIQNSAVNKKVKIIIIFNDFEDQIKEGFKVMCGGGIPGRPQSFIGRVWACAEG